MCSHSSFRRVLGKPRPPLAKVFEGDAHPGLGIIQSHHSNTGLQMLTVSQLLSLDVYSRSQILINMSVDVPGFFRIFLLAAVLRNAIRTIVQWGTPASSNLELSFAIYRITCVLWRYFLLISFQINEPAQSLFSNLEKEIRIQNISKFLLRTLLLSVTVRFHEWCHTHKMALLNIE